RDARQRGLAEPKIKQQLEGLGWSTGQVEKAIGDNREKLSKRPDQSAQASTTTEPAEASSEVKPAAVAPGQSPGAAGIPERRVPDDYVIGAGDTLQVSVWKEPDVTVPSVVVRPDGKITVPLIKEVEVAGMTPPQVEKLITAGLAKYITDANVTVVVAAINSK